MCAGSNRACAFGGTERVPRGRDKLLAAQAEGGGRRFGSHPWACEGGTRQRGSLLSHRVVVQGGAAQAQRQIAVIRKFKRLGEGLSTRDGPQVCMCPPNPRLYLGTLPHLTALCLVFSLGPCPSLSGSPSLTLSLYPTLQFCTEPPLPAPPLRTVRTTK